MRQPDHSSLREQKLVNTDQSGYEIEMQKTSFHQIDLKWASYINPVGRTMTFRPERPMIISHFRLQEPAGGQPLGEKQFIVYREQAPYDLQVTATGKHRRSFFELGISEDFFEQLFTPESPFMNTFREKQSEAVPTFTFKAPMVAAMERIIHEIKNAPYTGHLKGLYLEAKSVELFLQQVQQFDLPEKPLRLTPADTARLHAVKSYIDQHYGEVCSISSLARMAGINQTKLKTGFKALFSHTVFGYVSDIRLQQAKQLLQDQKMPVNEVAELAGYKHPHHFSAAFKRKFGVLPRELR
jgi:AraC-like DNA-binding protein